MPKMIAGKYFQMTKKVSHADLIKKGLTWCVKIRCVCGR